MQVALKDSVWLTKSSEHDHSDLFQSETFSCHFWILGVGLQAFVAEHKRSCARAVLLYRASSHHTVGDFFRDWAIQRHLSHIQNGILYGVGFSMGELVCGRARQGGVMGILDWREKGWSVLKEIAASMIAGLPVPSTPSELGHQGQVAYLCLYYLWLYFGGPGKSDILPGWLGRRKGAMSRTSRWSELKQ